jgi:hypothetical protein
MRGDDKYYILSDADGYSMTLDTADTIEEAEKICMEIPKDVFKVIRGKELIFRPKEVVKTWELVEADD